MSRQATPTPKPPEKNDTDDEPSGRLPTTSRAKRNRSWEAKQRQGGRIVVTYRGIPDDLRDAVTEIAAELSVPVGDVAAVFLQYAVTAYRDGALKAERRLQSGKFTLF